MSPVGLFLVFLSIWTWLVPSTARAGGPAIEADKTAAVIFAYHRIGDDAHPNTSLRLDQFESQLKELKDGGYHVLKLSDVIDAYKGGKALPDRTVVLTFDGGYRSFLETAWPRLKSYRFPFTLFINPAAMAAQREGLMDWDDIDDVADTGLADIGITTGAGESRAPLRAALNSAIALYRDEMGISPRFFAYPFGAYTKTHVESVVAAGFDAAFGQQSGVAFAGADIFTLPRFTLTERYGDMGRFAMTANALPLPARDITPDDPALSENAAPPAIGFTLPASLSRYAKGLSCFVSGQDKVQVESIGSGRVELRLAVPLDDVRTRVNCTLPGPADEDGNARWRWVGMLLTLPGGPDDGPDNTESPGE